MIYPASAEQRGVRGNKRIYNFSSRVYMVQTRTRQEIGRRWTLKSADQKEKDPEFGWELNVTRKVIESWHWNQAKAFFRERNFFMTITFVESYFACAPWFHASIKNFSCHKELPAASNKEQAGRDQALGAEYNLGRKLLISNGESEPPKKLVAKRQYGSNHGESGFSSAFRFLLQQRSHNYAHEGRSCASSKLQASDRGA